MPIFLILKILEMGPYDFSCHPLPPLKEESAGINKTMTLFTL
jgi:hypothetical protein